jgi:hypothetical protein
MQVSSNEVEEVVKKALSIKDTSLDPILGSICKRLNKVLDHYP